MGRISKRPPIDPASQEDLGAFTDLANQTDVFASGSYLDLGPRNSALMINRYEEDNGYLAIFTNLDTHIEVNDTVFITENGGNSELDNFISYKYNDNFPFTDFSQGYKVIKVEKDKNKIVIDKIFKDTIINLNLSEHYVSLVKGEEGIIKNSEINGAIWKNGSLINNKIIQGIFIEANSTGSTFISKYEDNYQSLKRFVSNDGLLVNQNNYTYGYNFVGYSGKTSESELINSDINSGNFYKCNIISNNKTRTILNGYFVDCKIDNYLIKGGYFLNCEIKDNCEWYNGTYENNDGSKFGPSTWRNGTWALGNFSGKTWLNGTFNGIDNTLFIDSIWENGRFNNGIISESTWNNGFFDNGKFSNSDWSGGTFNNGTMYNSNWSGGTVNNGTFQEVYWMDGTFNKGNIIDSIWLNGDVRYGIIQGTWFGGKFYDGKIYNSTWVDGIFYNGIFENSIWSGGTFFNGTMLESDWITGTWRNGTFQDGNWYSGNWSNGTMKGSYIKDIYWVFGYMKDCTIDEEGDVTIIGGTIENTDLISISGATNITTL